MQLLNFKLHRVYSRAPTPCCSEPSKAKRHVHGLDGSHLNPAAGSLALTRIWLRCDAGETRTALTTRSHTRTLRSQQRVRPPSTTPDRRSCRRHGCEAGEACAQTRVSASSVSTWTRLEDLASAFTTRGCVRRIAFHSNQAAS